MSRRMAELNIQDGKLVGIDGIPLYGGGEPSPEPPSYESEGFVADLENGLKYQNFNGAEIKGISNPKYTTRITDMSFMFYTASNLTAIPEMDTSNVTTMRYTFSNCSKLASIPKLNTSKVTDMSYMFNYCSHLVTVPEMDTSNVTEMEKMFFGCTFLTSIPAFDVTNVTNLDGAFIACNRLVEFHMINMKVDFNISHSTKFTREALLEIINNCYDVKSLGKTATLTMGATNLGKLTKEDKAIATGKGWTLE